MLLSILSKKEVSMKGSDFFSKINQPSTPNISPPEKVAITAEMAKKIAIDRLNTATMVAKIRAMETVFLKQTQFQTF